MRSFFSRIKPLLFALLLWPVFVQAETIPATAGPGPSHWEMQNGGGSGATATAAAQAWCANNNTAFLRLDPSGDPNIYWAYCTNATYAQVWHKCINGGTYPNCNGTSYSCPANQNWTLSGSNCTRPDCVLPQVRNVDTGVCTAPPCSSKGEVSSGLYPMGSDPRGSFPAVICSGGCLALFSGTVPAKYAMVAGERTYYASGSYDFAGGGSSDACTPGEIVPAGAPAQASLGPQSCAPNQIEGEVNGIFQCWNTPEDAKAAVEAGKNASSVPSKETSTSSTTNNTTNNTTTETTVINHAGGGTTTTTKVCTTGTADCTTTTEKAGLPEGNVGGGAAALSSLYSPDSGKTFAGSINSFRAAWAAAPIVASSSNFFRVGDLQGACSGMSSSFSLLGQNVTIDLAPHFCTESFSALLTYIAMGLLLAASAAAFWIAIL